MRYYVICLAWCLNAINAQEMVTLIIVIITVAFLLAICPYLFVHYE